MSELDPTSDPNSSTTPAPRQDPSFYKSKRKREVFARQVQAFLDASDEVDIDQEIVDDILQGFDGELHFDGDVEVDIEDDNEPGTEARFNLENEDDDGIELEKDDNEDASDLDVSQEEGKSYLAFVFPRMRLYIRRDNFCCNSSFLR